MNGARIGITGARRAEEQATLVRKLGGVPIVAPALRGDAPQPDEVIGPVVDTLIDEPFDTIVFLTGVGARVIFEHAARRGREPALRDRLSRARVIARGVKPRRALRAVGLRVDTVVDPPVVTAVRDLLLAEPVTGRRYFVQGYGPDPVEVAVPLRAAGASVLTLSPYSGSLPQDVTAVARLARDAVDGRLAALTFTSALAARQFMVIAEPEGIDARALNEAPVLIVAVGEVTRGALERDGLRVDVEPKVPRMGAMYQELARVLTGS